MQRLLIITRHNFVQAASQPVYWLMIVLAVAVVGIYTGLPFFTLGDDTRMFKTVSMDVVMLLVLISTLLATSKSIYDEIEDRTMLTLMSKPVARWEVLLGKYLGIVLAAGVAIGVLAVVLTFSVAHRVPSDYLLPSRSLYAEDVKRLADYRMQHLLGLWPGMVLMWMQVAVLAAISVAISTRFSFIVNLPVVLLIYLGGNLARFIDAAVEYTGAIGWSLGQVVESLLPFLRSFDLRELTIFATILIPDSPFDVPTAVPLSAVWIGTATAGLYALCYITAALALGLLLFRARELGGAEG